MQLTSTAFTPLAVYAIRQEGFVGFQTITDKICSARIPLTLRYLSTVLDTAFSLRSAADINLVWENYIDDRLTDVVSADRVSPNAFCVRQRLWALGKAFRMKEMHAFFDTWYRSGLFYADSNVYRILIQFSRAYRDYPRLTALFAELKTKGISPDQATYNSLISAFVEGGEMDLAKQALEDMAAAQLEPTQTTFEALLLMACTGTTVDADKVLSVVRRAFSSGAYVPRGHAWRQTLVALLRRLGPDQVAEVVAEALALNPASDIDVMDSLLLVNVERFITSAHRHPNDNEEAQKAISDLWVDIQDRSDKLSDSTLSLMLRYTEIVRGGPAAVEMAKQLAARLSSFVSARQTTATIVRIYCANNMLGDAQHLLRGAARRAARPLTADAFPAIIRALAPLPSAIVPMFNLYISIFKWTHSATVVVVRAAVETLARVQLFSSATRPSSAQEVEAALVPSVPPPDAVAGLDEIARIVDEETSARPQPDLMFLLVQAYSLSALARVNSNVKADSPSLKRALQLYKEATRNVSLDISLALIHRLALAMILSGDGLEVEGEKLLRRATRSSKAPPPPALLRVLLASKLRKVTTEFQASRQFVSKTPLISTISSLLREATSLYHQLLLQWQDASMLPTLMTHLALDGEHGRHRALEMFYDTFRKHHVQPPPAAFRWALTTIASVRDDAIGTLFSAASVLFLAYGRYRVPGSATG